jgi:hypothetical protein
MQYTTWLFALPALMVASATAHAQSQTQDTQIQLGVADLTLGMPQAEALRRLALIYDLNYAAGSPGAWIVLRKDPRTVVGNVSFRNERLVFVNKGWAPAFAENQTARAVSQALHDAVQAVAGQGRECRVSAETLDSAPGLQPLYRTTVHCGRRRLNVTASQDPRMLVDVSETLTSDP